MKKVIISLAVFFSLSLLAGCANELGVSPLSSGSDEMAMVNVNVGFEKAGVLAKAMATASIEKPTRLIVTLLPDYKTDTIAITGVETSISLKYLLKKDNDYQLLLTASNPIESPNYAINHASPKFTVPNVDTFHLDVNVPVLVSKLALSLVLKGSPAELSANNVKMVWDRTSSASWPDSCVVGFAPATKDTVNLAGLIAVNTSYLVVLTISNSDGSYYQGKASISPTPSTDEILSIVLTKYDKNGAFVETSIVLAKASTVLVKALWS